MTRATLNDPAARRLKTQEHGAALAHLLTLPLHPLIVEIDLRGVREDPASYSAQELAILTKKVSAASAARYAFEAMTAEERNAMYQQAQRSMWQQGSEVWNPA